MAFSPHLLLSNAARERCLAGIKELPNLIFSDVKPKVKAAVLVPLCIDKGEVCLLYTLRSSNLTKHSGQVSFPGGKMDNNETVFETALRETEEEIGIKPEDVEIWTQMPKCEGRDKITEITPVVGFIKNFHMNNLKVNPYEVEEVFRVPMSALCNNDYHGHLDLGFVITPVYLYEKFKIWGITGMITHLFLQCFLPENVYSFDFMRKSYKFDDLMPSKL